MSQPGSHFTVTEAWSNLLLVFQYVTDDVEVGHQDDVIAVRQIGFALQPFALPLHVVNGGHVAQYLVLADGGAFLIVAERTETAQVVVGDVGEQHGTPGVGHHFKREGHVFPEVGVDEVQSCVAQHLEPDEVIVGQGLYAAVLPVGKGRQLVFAGQVGLGVDHPFGYGVVVVEFYFLIRAEDHVGIRSPLVFHEQADGERLNDVVAVHEVEELSPCLVDDAVASLAYPHVVGLRYDADVAAPGVGGLQLLQNVERVVGATVVEQQVLDALEGLSQGRLHSRPQACFCLIDRYADGDVVLFVHSDSNSFFHSKDNCGRS